MLLLKQKKFIKPFQQLLKYTSDPVNQEIILFLFILFIAAFLRFYQLPQIMPFIGDQARDFIAAKGLVLTKKIPLLGIPSSVSQFHQGPVYIWALAIVFSIFGFNPLNAGYFAAATGIISVGIIYVFGRKWFDKTTAFFAAILLATSPLAVAHSQFAFVINPIPLFSLFYLGSLINYLKQKKATLFLPALTFALLFQFELATAPLILLIALAAYIKKTTINKSTIIPAIVGLLLGLLPQIIFDLTNGFNQLGKFIAWTGYRLASFFLPGSSHVISFNNLRQTTNLIIEFTHKLFSWGSTPIYAIIVFLLILGFYKVVTLIVSKKNNNPILLTYSWLILLITSFYIHGSPSEAYFPALFIPLILAAAWSLKTTVQPKTRKAIYALVAGIALFNVIFLISTNILSQQTKKPSPYPTTVWLPRISIQKQVVERIIEETKGESVYLRAMGPGSQFASFLDNYRYLLWLNNIDLDITGADVWIIKGEKATNPPFLNAKSWFFDKVTLTIPF